MALNEVIEGLQKSKAYENLNSIINYKKSKQYQSCNLIFLQGKSEKCSCFCFLLFPRDCRYKYAPPVPPSLHIHHFHLHRTLPFRW